MEKAVPMFFKEFDVEVTTEAEEPVGFFFSPMLGVKAKFRPRS